MKGNIKQFTTKITYVFPRLKFNCEREEQEKERKRYRDPRKEKNCYATYGVLHSCWRFHLTPSPLRLLSAVPSRTPLGFARPTLSRKEGFLYSKGKKQIIKRFKAIMYLKSGSWPEISDEFNLLKYTPANRAQGKLRSC